LNECTLFSGQETFKINFIMFVIKTDKQTKTHERPFMESMRLKNKTAVITGASRGIGKAIALQFASEGCNIVINFRSNEQAAQDVKAQVKAKGVTGLVIQADVTDREAVKKMFKDTKEKLGHIDILVNNAGINKRGWFDELTDEDWDMIMGVNLKGPFICCQEVFPYMKEQNCGRIINISSVAGQYHGPKTVHYAVSKAGLNSLTKVLSRYGAEHNILVNAVAPGLIYTDQTADEFASPAGQKIIDMTLLKRAGQLEDVTSACVFLASDEQNYMTGQILSVSGGAYLG
jgi:3-oxoacyl-[acyl-carrier protein] reductase